MAPVLAFRHIPAEHLGLLGDALRRHAIDFEYVDLSRASGPPLSICHARALIFMGGPMSANEESPYIRQELLYIAQAASQNKPLLGICLGAQLIAKALGARVFQNAVKEIGWAAVDFTAAAACDPLFHGLQQPQMMFHWHSETFDLPARAELLASSAACRHQAYRVGDRIYGLQFHLEVTAAMIADWLVQDANSGDMRELAEPFDPCAHSAAMAETARIVFARWCHLIQRI